MLFYLEVNPAGERIPGLFNLSCKSCTHINGKDIYQDIAYPVTRQFRQEMYEEIEKEFNAVMEKEGQQEEDADASEE